MKSEAEPECHCFQPLTPPHLPNPAPDFSLCSPLCHLGDLGALAHSVPDTTSVTVVLPPSKLDFRVYTSRVRQLTAWTLRPPALVAVLCCWIRHHQTKCQTQGCHAALLINTFSRVLSCPDTVTHSRRQ